MGDVKKVLVFGSSGAGKTSLLNNITGEEYETSSGALGCTFDSTKYKPVRLGNADYVFTDTAGLNEGSSGTVTSKKAIANLINLILTNKEGFNLLIMVIRCGRIDAAIERQYNLFVNHLAEDTVPVILVVTGCECESSLSAWTDDCENKNALEKYNMKFKAVIGTTCARSFNPQVEQFYRVMREESKNKVINEILKHSLKSPMPIIKTSALDLVRKVYNFVAQVFNWKRWTSALSKLLISLGFTEDEALATESRLL